MATIGLKLDWETLEKLLNTQGPEFKLELSQSVLNTFCKNYVKGIENGAFAEKIRKDAQRAFDRAAKEAGLEHISYQGYKLSSEQQKQVDREVEQAFKDYIRNSAKAMVDSALDTDKLEKLINYFVEKKVASITNAEVNNQVKAKLEEMRRVLG